MKKHISLLCMVCMGFAPCVGQNFTYHSDSPFGIQIVRPDTTRGAQTIFFYDYDVDGDLDMLVTGLDYFDDVPGLLQWKNIHFFIEWQENIGDAHHPLFAERQDIFPDFPYPTGYFLPTIGDLDNDNDADFIVGAEIDWIGNEKLLMLNNTGLSGQDQFDVTTLDEMGLADFVPESLYKPHLMDLDRDGDLDLMASGFDSAFGEEDGPDVPAFIYARNIGTKNAPNFQGWYDYPYEIYPSPYGELITSGDIDNDEDIDFVGALLNTPPDSIGYLVVHLNTPGANGKPAFGVPLHSPYGMPTTFGEVQMIFPTLADIDGDGDLDLFVFSVDPEGTAFQYYENTLCQGSITELSVSICEGEVFEVGGETYSVQGDYTIDLEDTNGCDSTLLLSLLVEETYHVDLGETICEGESFQVGTEIFTAPGHYEVLFTSQTGCDSIISLELNVLDVDNSVTLQQNILSANQSGATYQWVDCDTGLDIPGATGQSYEVLVTGNYAVHVTDGSDCSETSECLFVMVTTGLGDQLYASEITIYPNPADNVISIRNETSLPITSIKLIHLSGQVVREYQHEGVGPINISTLEHGVYFVKMSVNEQVVIRKLVVL